MISRIFNPTYIDHLINWLMTSGIRVVVIGLGAYVFLKLISILIGRIEKIMVKDKGEFFITLETEKRVKTIGNILRKATFAAVFIIALMMILREVGMDITPILTGAGIIGLAVGFGAQNLVRDVISGFFILIENQVRVGDVAEINGTGGLVEEINLRTIVLRDLEGVVHIFPNGTINTLSNRTRGWSRYVIDVGVAYKENVDNVMKLLNEIGEELCKDEYFSPLILEPLEILGVDNFGNSEVIIKCMIKTQPLKQWEVGRELRRRIKNTFDQKGVEIPFPHVSVYFGEASKPFALDITDSRDSESILNHRGYELVREIAKKTGKSPDEILKEALENIGKCDKG
jgi:small conductance mechanosensitive channel